MEDIFNPQGSTKASKPDAGGANLRPVPVIGIVKDNIDPVRSGRIQVYIADLNGEDPDNSDSWVTVSYLSPFYGFVEPIAGQTGYGSFKANPASYGMWFSPPDIGTEVICIFVNGDMNYGYYIGAIPKPEALHMVPAIGSSDNVVPNSGEAAGLGGAERLPVTNMNTNNEAKANESNFLKTPKPVHSYVTAIMQQQGIIRDPIRGPISSSANRESPSRVGWGVSTPGRPIYEGGFDDQTIGDAANSGNPQGLRVISRRGGHSIVMDDGDLAGNDQVVRIRTALGHQILMSDNGQTLMILHSNGQSYIELGKEGTIDMYSTNSVNIRTQGDLNLHADNDININAAKKLNIQAESINVNAEKDFNQKTGTDSKIYTMGTHTHKVDGPMSMESSGEASYASSSTTYINGSRINLNTGSTSTTPETVPPIPVVAHTDTLGDSVKGFAAAPGKLLSIATRAPAHYPWANAGQGVDVKSKLSASEALPTPPNPAVSAVNAAAASTAPGNPVTVAGAATMPPVNPISSALDKNTTAAMVGAVAKNAALGPAAAAVQAGSGVISTAQGAIASVGALGLNPNQLQSGGVLKPGAATLVNSLVQQGANVTTAMTNNLFTGKAGAENLNSLVQNTTAQVATQVANFQQSQTALTNAGLMTGKESSGSVAGLVMSGATAGVSSTVNAIKNVAGTAAGAVNNLVGGALGAIGGAAGSVTNALNSGNFAAGIAQNVTGGFGAISSALGSMAKVQGVGGLFDAAKGVAGSAFAAITNSFKPLQAGVPQNLTAIAAAQNAASAVSNAVSSVAGGVGSLVTGAASSLTSGISAATGALTSAAGSIGGAVGSVVAGAQSVTSGITGAASSLSNAAATVASGVNALPGGQNAISAVVNKAPGAINQVPGTEAITSLINNASSSVTNNISLQNSISSVTNIAGQASSLTSGLTTAASGIMNKLSSGASSLASLASAGLPAAAASQLNSAIAALSSVSSVPIKLPAVGINTTDRSTMVAQVTGILSDRGIPAPNFTGNITPPPSLSELREKRAKYEEKAKERDEIHKELTAAKRKFYQLKNDLPAGDPQLNAARDEWFALVDKFQAAVTEANTYLT
jgi:phage-related protein